MNISFFSEAGFSATPPRDFNNMRTEYAWYVALDAMHHSIQKLPELQDKMYDLGVVIIPKKNIENLMQFPMIEQLRRVCKKIGFMQEGPAWYFQDYPMEQQIWFYNTLMEMDVIFAHNQSDVKYFKGLTGKKNCHRMLTLMLTDNIREAKNKSESVMIGGNMVRWYGGFDSYIIANSFSENRNNPIPIYAPSMGRRIDREDELDNLTHLSYMTWVDWMTELSKHRYGVHLMPTHAAGTFSLNCAYLGIPCIGYRGLDTQEELHPHCSVTNGNLDLAREIAKRLTTHQDFYEQCSKEAKENYKEFFSEEVYTYDIKKVIENIMNK